MKSSKKDKNTFIIKLALENEIQAKNKAIDGTLVKHRGMAMITSKLIIVALLIVLFSSAGVIQGKVKAEDREQDVISLPIIMYHAVVPSNSTANKYAVTTTQLASDLDYFISKGYNTINVADLVAYTSGKGKLPKNPIMLTFDDGYHSTLSKVVPMLLERKQKAVCGVVGEFCKFSVKYPEKQKYSYLSYDDIVALAATGVFEIQNHTNNLHWQNDRSGANIKKGENVSDYKAILKKDLTTLKTNLEQRGIATNCLVYPYGSYNKFSEEVVREMGYKSSVTCNEGINYISKNPNCLYLLKRYNRSGVGKSAIQLLANYNTVG